MERQKLNAKLIMLGDVFVGKTSIIYRYIDGIFEKYRSGTLGCDFKCKSFQVDDRQITLNFWDTAGLERFKAINKNYLYNPDIVIIVFDLSEPKTFDSVFKWIDLYYDSNTYHNIQGVPIIVLGNKCDLITEMSINYAEDARLKSDPNIHYFEVSAKENLNLDYALNSIIPIGLKNFLKKRNFVCPPQINLILRSQLNSINNCC